MSAAHGLGDGLRSGRADGCEEFRAGNGGGAAFHDNKAAGDVGEVGGFERRGAAGEAEGVDSEDGVARPGDVDGLIAAVDGDVGRLHAGLEKGEAVAAAGDDEGLELHLFECGAAAALEFCEIFSDGGVVEGFKLAFVGRGGTKASALVVCEAIAGVECREQGSFVGGENLRNNLGTGNAETIVGNSHGIGLLQGPREDRLNFAVSFGGQRMDGFVVYAENLLASFVGPASEEAGFGGSGPAFDTEDAGDIHFFCAEEFEEAVTGFIFANGGDGKDFCAERDEIVGGVGAAAGDNLRFAVLEDEDGGFAGDAGDVAELEGVGNEIAENDDGFGGEALNDFGERDEIHGGCGNELFFGALGHLGLRIPGKRKHTRTVERIQVGWSDEQGLYGIQRRRRRRPKATPTGEEASQETPPTALIAGRIRPWPE